ncbi:MAG: hypothetical protein K940chlam9_01420 [Chlamydiae bacterium]|nr:hypothetical protein [Chlamydiota bacterium]
MTDPVSLNPEISSLQAQKTTTHDRGSPFIGNNVSPIMLAYLMLVEAASNTTESALLQSKELQANAASQQRLNKEQQHLQMQTVPKEKIDHHKDKHSHWSWGLWQMGQWNAMVTNYTFRTSIPNLTKVKNAEARNQEISAQRSIISDRLLVTQQSAKIQMTEINTKSNTASEIMSETGALMNMVKSLTFKALMTQPESGF